MYRYQWVDSIVKISLILADKSGLRKKPKVKEPEVMKGIDLGGESLNDFLAGFGFGAKQETPIDKVRKEYNEYRKNVEQLNV